MMKSLDKRSSVEDIRGATLSKSNFAKVTRLPRDMTRSPGFHEQHVSLRGFKPREVTCGWHADIVSRESAPREFRILLERGDMELANFLFRHTHVRVGGECWELVHREVDTSVRRMDVGTFALKTGENFVRELHRAYPEAPAVIGISTTRPSLIEFMLRNGYTYVNDSEKAVFEKFLKEREENRDTEAYIQHRELPSFVLVRFFRGNIEQDEVLIDKRVLRHLHGENVALADVFEKDAGRYVLRLLGGDLLSQADAVRIHLRKSVDNVQ